MTDPVLQLAWEAYGAAVRHWRLCGGGGAKPRAALQLGRHITTLPLERNPEGENLPALVDAAAGCPASWCFT